MQCGSPRWRPGLAEIEQLHDLLWGARGGCPMKIHLLHSVVPHDQQRLALDPPPGGHAPTGDALAGAHLLL